MQSTLAAEPQRRLGRACVAHGVAYVGVVMRVCGSGAWLGMVRLGSGWDAHGAMSRCILAVYISYKQYLTVWAREWPPARRVPGAIYYENRLVSSGSPRAGPRQPGPSRFQGYTGSALAVGSSSKDRGTRVRGRARHPLTTLHPAPRSPTTVIIQ
jgi:hypothetical protein